MGKDILMPTAVDTHQARLKHDKRVAAARARLDAINAKVEKNRLGGAGKGDKPRVRPSDRQDNVRLRGATLALQAAAARFLPEGEQLPEPRVLDLVRWPYAGAARKLPRALRDAILAEDVLCVWCRVEPSTTIDHVRPLNRGGSNHPLNLVGACQPCNSAKSDFLPSELGWVLRLPRRAFELAQAPGMGRRALE